MKQLINTKRVKCELTNKKLIEQLINTKHVNCKLTNKKLIEATFSEFFSAENGDAGQVADQTDEADDTVCVPSQRWKNNLIKIFFYFHFLFVDRYTYFVSIPSTVKCLDKKEALVLKFMKAFLWHNGKCQNIILQTFYLLLIFTNHCRGMVTKLSKSISSDRQI